MNKFIAKRAENLVMSKKSSNFALANALLINYNRLYTL